MRVICEYFEGDRIDEFVVVVLSEVEGYKVCALQRSAIDGICVRMLCKPGEDVREVEDGTRSGADGICERLQRDGAVIERKAPEC